MKKAGIVLLVVAVVIGFAIATVTAYDAGQDDADSALDCTAGDILSLTEVRTPPAPDGTAGEELVRTISLGDCERISEEALAAALQALASSPASDEDPECKEPSAGEDTATTLTTAPASTVPGAATPTTAAADPCKS